MNKKLVAAALGLAFAAPVFADSSNVTLYGRVHQALDHQSTSAPTGDTGGNFALEDVSSRFGIRGTEDLGGGLSAIFAYEFSVAADANAGVGGRHSYIGLKGSWGTFVAGKQDGGNESVAPLYTQASLTGGVSNQGGPLTTIGGGVASLANNVAISRTQRTDNSFGYKTSIAGVALEARHALRGTNDQANNTPVKENGVRETEVAATYKVDNASSPLVNFNLALTTEQKLEAIITQKWIALNMVNCDQSWNDYRRTLYPKLNNAPGATKYETFASLKSESTRPDKLPTRILYPSSEGIYNATNVPKGLSPFTSLIFWAK